MGTLIGGLAAAGIIGGDDPSPPSQASTTTTGARPTTTGGVVPFEPTEQESALLAVIPLVIRGDCRRSDEKEPAEAVARLRCQPPDLDGGYVGYSLFDSASAVNQYMNPRLSLGDKAGVCGHDASGVSTYRNTEKEAIGRLLCHLDDDDDAWIEWTNIQLNVYAYAYRFDSNWKALFNFWNNAGPNAANGS